MQSSSRPMRVAAVLLLLVIANAYVFASGGVSTAGNTSEAGSAKALLGRLITNNNRPIIVNGGEAITGTVIVSGTQLVTPAASGAIVQLEKLGTVSIAPSSTVSVAFDAKSVTVNVAAGYADVKTVDGVKGTVLGLPNTPGSNPAPAGGNSAKNWGIAGVAIGSAAFIWAIISWNKANNAEDDAKAAQASAATLAAQLAALRTCLAGQTQSPVKLCTSF